MYEGAKIIRLNTSHQIFAIFLKYLSAVDRKKHILFLSSWFPNRTHPTLGNFVQRHAEAVALFAQVTVLYLVKDVSIHSIEVEDSLENDVRIIRVYYPKNGFLFSQRRKALQFGINHLLKTDRKPDLIQLNMIWPEGWQAVNLSKKFKIPFVISDNWTGYHPTQRGPLPFYIKTYMRWVANHAALLLPVTQQLEDAMRNLGFTSPSIIIPNVVNTTYFKKGVKNEGIIRFLHLSHLDDNHKNISGLLRAWKQFTAHNTSCELHLGGDGDASHYQNRIVTEGISNVHFFGTLNQEQVAAKMNEADVFVLFSNYENLPLVVIEAMACGLLVIATDVGGVKEHLKAELGHQLIQARDEQALLDAFNLASQTVPHRNQDEIIHYAVSHFSYESVGKAFIQAYEQAWNN